jgi:hypothetical protein
MGSPESALSGLTTSLTTWLLTDGKLAPREGKRVRLGGFRLG